jgi:predicted DNA-binding transcriptional regulator AlpA
VSKQSKSPSHDRYRVRPPLERVERPNPARDPTARSEIVTHLLTSRGETSISTLAVNIPNARGLSASIDPLAMLGKGELAALLGVSPWTIDRFRKNDPTFPKPLWISATTPRWRRRDVELWLDSRPCGGRAPSFEGCGLAASQAEKLTSNEEER